MDHVWQIGPIGPPEHEMLEAYTALGWLAAKTERVKLLAMVTAVVYREPGLLAKAVTTLDVLSGGRAILGIGAAWNGEESAGLGLLFPPVSERFERLEEAILICKQMWSGDEGPFDGEHYHLGRTLNSPQALSRPHPPILIGGSGEKKTLKLVARYADACNIAAYDLDATAHKLDVLRQHCVNEGRDYDEIEKTAQTRYDLGENGENVNRTIEQLHRVAELGFSQVHGSLLGVSRPGRLDLLAERVIPAVEKF
jgi:F420-dependent oxidoreductase-like protein